MLLSAEGYGMDAETEETTDKTEEKPVPPVGLIVAGMIGFLMMWIVIFIAAYAFTETTNH